MRIQNEVKLCLVEVLLVWRRRRLGDPVRVVKEQAEVTQASDARFRTNGRHARLDAWVTHRALLGLAGVVVEVDLLVRAPGHAHAPAATGVLVDKHDAILGPLVHRAGRARGHARGVEAVLANTWQVEHERLLVFELDPIGDLAVNLLDDRVLGGCLRGSSEVVIPVG